MPGNLFGNGPGFFDAITHLFANKKAASREATAVAPSPSSLSDVEAAFNAALIQLNRKIDDLSRRERGEMGEAGSLAVAAQAREERLRSLHAQVVEDILALHGRLGTGIDRTALDELSTFVDECAQAEGKQGEELLQCCRSGILRRLHLEAGPVAWAKMDAALRVAGEDWPVATQRDRFEDEATFAHRLQHKRREAAAAFSGYPIGRSAELIKGVERAWKSDYPERGTPLWRELVMEGVATGLRAQVFKGYVECLKQHQGIIVKRATELVGRELEELHKVLAEKGAGTLEDAHRVGASSQRLLNEVIPEQAWQVVKGALHSEK